MSGRTLLDPATLTVGIASLIIGFAAPAHAIDDCGVGMYYNNANDQCEPWAPVGVDFDGVAPVAVPVPLGIGFDPVPLGIGFDPGFGLNVPNIAPYLRLPGIGLPGIGLPGIGIPDVRVPGIGVPDVRVPAVRVPDVRVPDVRVPEVHVGRR